MSIHTAYAIIMTTPIIISLIALWAIAVKYIGAEVLDCQMYAALQDGSEYVIREGHHVSVGRLKPLELNFTPSYRLVDIQEEGFLSVPALCPYEEKDDVHSKFDFSDIDIYELEMAVNFAGRVSGNNHERFDGRFNRFKCFSNKVIA